MTDEPSSKLREFGQADAYGCFSIGAGALAFILSFSCCAGSFFQEKEAVALYVFLMAAAIWCGAFGAVMRGTPAGRTLAHLGLGFAVASLAVGSIAVCLDSGF